MGFISATPTIRSIPPKPAARIAVPSESGCRATARSYPACPNTRLLVSEHARFHRAVGRVVEQANAGKNVQEEAVLGSDSEFADSSRNIVQAIVQLKRKTATA